MNPNQTITIFLFISIATLLSAGIGWLMKKGALPLKKQMNFSETQWQFMRVWVKVALVIGVILPLIMLVAFWQESIPRLFFSYYLLAVAVQLACEVSFSRWLCPSIVVIIGTLYTGFRIWQLWSGLHLVGQPWLVLLWLVLLFWIANMIMLVTIAWTSILPELKENSVNEN